MDAWKKIKKHSTLNCCHVKYLKEICHKFYQYKLLKTFSQLTLEYLDNKWYFIIF